MITAGNCCTLHLRAKEREGRQRQRGREQKPVNTAVAAAAAGLILLFAHILPHGDDDGDDGGSDGGIDQCTTDHHSLRRSPSLSWKTVLQPPLILLIKGVPAH